MPRVFVSDFIPGDILEPLATLADMDVWSQPSAGVGPRISSGGQGVAPQISSRVPRETLLERLAACDGWLSMLSDTIDVELLDAAPKLRVISQMSVGVDNIDVEACRGHGVTVGHTPDVLTETTADTAFALIGAAVRRLPEGEAIVKSGAWGPWDPWHFLSSDLHGATLGIVGMGRIGQAVARRARGFGMRIHYHGRHRLPPEIEQGAWFHHSLQSLLPEARFLSLHCPATPETERMINAETLALLPQGAVLINTARGALLDDEAVLAALDSGQLFAAGLDVYAGEPALHPGYRTRRNGFFLPHLGSATIETRNAMGFRCLDNLDALLAGRAPPDALN